VIRNPVNHFAVRRRFEQRPAVRAMYRRDRNASREPLLWINSKPLRNDQPCQVRHLLRNHTPNKPSATAKAGFELIQQAAPEGPGNAFGTAVIEGIGATRVIGPSGCPVAAAIAGVAGGGIEAARNALDRALIAPRTVFKAPELGATEDTDAGCQNPGVP